MKMVKNSKFSQKISPPSIFSPNVEIKLLDLLVFQDAEHPKMLLFCVDFRTFLWHLLTIKINLIKMFCFPFLFLFVSIKFSTHRVSPPTSQLIKKWRNGWRVSKKRSYRKNNKPEKNTEIVCAARLPSVLGCQTS